MTGGGSKPSAPCSPGELIYWRGGSRAVAVHHCDRKPGGELVPGALPSLTEVEIAGRQERQPLTGRRAVTSPHRTGQLQFVTRPEPGRALVGTQAPRLQSFPADNPSPGMGSSSRFPAPTDPAHLPAAQGNTKPETAEDCFHQDVKHLKQIRRDLKILQMFNCLNEKLFLLQEVVTESWKMLQMDKCYYHYLCTSRFFQWLPERIPFVYRRTMCRPSLCRSVRRCCTRSCWESLQ